MSLLKILVFCGLLKIAVGQIQIVDPVIVAEHIADTCPVEEHLQDARDVIQSSILERLRLASTQRLNLSAMCGPGHWRQLYYLNMSNPTHSCPRGWTATMCPVRGCSGIDNTCASAYVPSKNRAYSKVCGQVSGVGVGLPDGFFRPRSSGRNIEGNYLDGVSITHGPAGSRHHIWSFAMGHTHRCPCDHSHPSFVQSQPPAEVNSNYFCSEIPDRNATELWQGIGCSTDDPCCSYNNPPFFSTHLPAITNESIEIRICSDEPSHDEDLSLTLIELYIQ